MKVLIRTLALVSVIALAVSLATATQTNPLASPPPDDRPYVPSSVIFPDQQIPVRFFHDKHLAEGVECAQCHEPAETSLAASDVLVPVGFEGEEICQDCHLFDEGADADPPAACTTCHFEHYDPGFPEGSEAIDSREATNRPAGTHIPVPNLKMNHKVHIDQGIECSRCHGELSDIQVATRENALPLMNTCMECHDGTDAPSECRTCHLAKPDGRLVNEFESGTLMPAGHFRNDAHDDNYLRTHAQTAKGDEQYCSNCHEERYCLACHNGVARPVKIHPNNWIVTHPLSARRNNPTCQSCHRAQSFCTDCHTRMQVVSGSELGPASQGQAFDTTRFGRFHPEGWTNDVNGGGPRAGGNFARGPNHHGFQAQRNIRACAACHTERTCTACHAETSFGSLGITPHPPGWRNSARCEALRNSNARVCTKCHSPDRTCTF